MKLPLFARILLFLGAGFGVLRAEVSPGQSLDPSFSNAELYRRGVAHQALELTNGKRVVAGEFLRANGQLVNGLVRFNADQTPDVVFNTHVSNNDWAPQQLVELPGGKLLVVSSTQQLKVDGVLRNNVVRLNADGSLDATFDAGAGTSSTLTCAAVQPDGKVLLGGYFTEFSGQAALALVRLNLDGSRDASFTSPNAAGDALQVAAVAVLPGSGQVLVGAVTAYLNGTARKGLLRLNANGTLDNTFAPGLPTNSLVHAVGVQPDGRILVIRTQYSSPADRAALLRLQATGASDPSFTPFNGIGQASALGGSSPERIVLQPDGKVLVLSEALSRGSNGLRNRLNRFTTAGRLDSTFSSPVGGAIQSVQVLASGNILLAGIHLYDPSGTAASVKDEAIVELDSNGTFDFSHAYTLWRSGFINAVAIQPDGKILVVGDIKQANGAAVSNIVRLLPDGATDAGFVCMPDDYVQAVKLLPNGQILIGGWFATVNGLKRQGVARLQPNGQPDASFKAPLTGMTGYFTSNIVLEPGGTMLVQGSYSDSVTFSYRNVYRLTSTGQMDPTFVVPPTVITNLAVQPDGRILVCGGLNDTGTRYLVYRLLQNGSKDPSFTLTPTPGTANTAQTVTLQPDGKILLGGTMRNFGTLNVGGLLRLNADGTPDAAFTAGVPQPTSVYRVTSLTAAASGQVLACGTAAWQNGSLVSPFAAYEQSGAPVAGLNRAKLPDGLVQTAVLQPDGQLLLAGSFGKADGQRRVGIARYYPNGILAATGSHPNVSAINVYPNPVRRTLHIQVDANARPQTAELVDLTGRVVLTQPVAQPNLTLDVRHLPAGVYLLRVAYATGPVTRRVVVQ